MKSILQVLAVIAAIFGLSHGIKIEKCDEDDAPEVTTLTVEIEDCEDERCILTKGKEYNFMVKFKATRNADNVNTIAIGTAYGSQLPLVSGIDNKACENIQRSDKKTEKGKACPLEKDTDYIYEKDIEIDRYEITAKPGIQWSMYDNGVLIYCFKLPVGVQ